MLSWLEADLAAAAAARAERPWVVVFGHKVCGRAHHAIGGTAKILLTPQGRGLISSQMTVLSMARPATPAG